MSAALRRILELERDGVAFSRNRHFDVFEERENRAALDLWNHIEAVRRALYKHHALGTVQLSLQRTEAGPCVLEVTIAEIGARARWHLDPREIGLLMRDAGVREWFAAAGIEVPEEGRAFLKPVLAGAP